MPATAASIRTSRPDDSAERWVQRLFTTPMPNSTEPGGDDRGRDRHADRHEQEWQDRDERAQAERRSHEQGPAEDAAAVLVDLDAELAGHHRPQEHLGMARHLCRDPRRLLLAEPFLGQHERDFGLGLAGPLLDLVALLVDLGVEDLALALAADVLAGGHREHAGQAAGDTGDDDGEGLPRRAGHGGHDGQRRDQAVLKAEHDLADLTEEGAFVALLGEVRGDPVPVVGGCRSVHRWSRGVSHGAYQSRIPPRIRVTPSAAAVAPADQPVGGDRPERPRQRHRGAVPALEREQAVGGGRVGRARVDDREVDRHPAGLRLAERRDDGIGAVAGLVLGADLGLGTATSAGGAGSPATRRRAPATPGRRPARARVRRPHHVEAACPAGRLVEQRVLVEVGVGGQPIGR